MSKEAAEKSAENKKKPLPIFIKRDGVKETRKLTLRIDPHVFSRVNKKYDINYSYVLEQILEHIDKNGLDSVLPVKFVRPKKK